MAAKSKPSRVACSSNRARRIRLARDTLSRREISSSHRTCRKSRCPRSPAAAWARRASRVSSMPDSFSCPQRLAEGGAVGDRDGAGHGEVSIAAGMSSSSLVIVPGMATTLANEAGPCRNAPAPPSPAAAAGGYRGRCRRPGCP